MPAPPLELEGSQQLLTPGCALLEPGPLCLDAQQLLSDPGGQAEWGSIWGGSTLPEAHPEGRTHHSPG